MEALDVSYVMVANEFFEPPHPKTQPLETQSMIRRQEIAIFIYFSQQEMPSCP